MKNYLLPLFVFFSIPLFSQKNEIGLQTNIMNAGISYEYFTNGHFSFGIIGGVGLFPMKKDDLAIMTSSTYSSKNLTKYYFSPYARYYFRNSFNAWFLMVQFYTSQVASTKFKDNIETNTAIKKYIGPLVGGGYKFDLRNNFTLNLYLTMGYDFNDNDLVPVLADGLISIGYKF